MDERLNSIFRSSAARAAVLDGQRTFLDLWPDSTTERMVPTREGETFVVTCGPTDAPPAVLLHGAGFNSASWTSDVATWAKTHRVLAIDVIGEPGRSAESRPAFGGDDYARWLDDVLDQLDIPQAAFVGASLGGWLALDYAIRRPARVERLAMLVPAGIGRQRLVPLLTLPLAPFGRRGRAVATDVVLGPRPGRSDDPVVAEHEQRMQDLLLLILDSYRPRRNVLPRFTDDQLRQLSIPVHVIAGAKDRLISAPDTARRLAELVPDASVDVRPGVGHIPTEYTDEIHRFLGDDPSD